jgi:hypothetical protein
MPNPYLTLVESWKTLPEGIDWAMPDPVDGHTSLYVPLTVAVVTVGSFALRGTCNIHRPECDVVFQLEIGLQGQRTRLPLAQVDWRPLSGGHKQPKIAGVGRREFLSGSHFHPLNDNWLEREQRMRETNLPWARAISPDPQSWHDLLDVSRELLRIDNMSIIPVPGWSVRF